MPTSTQNQFVPITFLWCTEPPSTKKSKSKKNKKLKNKQTTNNNVVMIVTPIFVRRGIIKWKSAEKFSTLFYFRFLYIIIFRPIKLLLNVTHCQSCAQNLASRFVPTFFSVVVILFVLLVLCMGVCMLSQKMLTPFLS